MKASICLVNLRALIWVSYHMSIPRVSTTIQFYFTYYDSAFYKSVIYKLSVTVVPVVKSSHDTYSVSVVYSTILSIVHSI